jgi:hypothetical protein
MEHQSWESTVIHGKKHAKSLGDKHKISYTQKLIRSLESAEAVHEVKIKNLVMNQNN